MNVLLDGRARRRLGIVITWLFVGAVVVYAATRWESIEGFALSLVSLVFQEQGGASLTDALLTVLTALVAGVSSHHAYTRRVRVAGRVERRSYFSNPEFTRLPSGRQGYSDRLAYTLAELADLAYWDAFPEVQRKSLERVIELQMKGDPDLDNVVHVASQLLQTKDVMSPEEFDGVLARGGFRLLRPFRAAGTQGFVCVHDAGDDLPDDHEPYAVVAFRGSEANIEDWLTNADAVPDDSFASGRVHSGFYQAYRRVAGDVTRALDEIREQYPGLPVYFTGHSLGGALALVATVLNARDSVGGCYTFGAPRVGDYAFFKGVKTPVYRVVNASDLVPRVPPGGWAVILKAGLRGGAFLTRRVRRISEAFEWLETWVDLIAYYRHHGDLRFLPDIDSAEIDDASQSRRPLQVLSNPDQLDMAQWFFRHIGVSFGMPIKSHSMKLYRNKLLLVASTRMEPFDIGEQQIRA